MEIKDFYEGYQQIDVPTNMPEETVRFFGHLGFHPVQVAGEGDTSVAFMQLHGLIVKICKIEATAMRDAGAGPVLLNLNVNSIDMLFTIVQSQGFALLDVGIKSQPVGNNEEKFFIILGPNGEKIKFFEITIPFAQYQKSHREKSEYRAILSKYIEKIRQKNTLETSFEIKRLAAGYNEILYGKDDWEMIYFFCNKLGCGVFDYIREHYPDLNEKLFKICCLSCVELRDKDIAFLLRISENTVRKYRNELHHSLNIPDHVKIHSFIIEKYVVSADFCKK